MAIAATSLWEHNTSATANMLNGGGFNTANANFPTDLTATSATGDSPVVSSATYTFVAGDVGHFLWISAGSNWTPGFYEIASVAAGAATLSAAVGAATQYTSASRTWLPSTVAGCATTASPTGGTFGIDYSRSTAAVLNNTDLACTTPSTTVTSATGGFTRMMVGNILHITAITGAGTLVGWYEIVNFSNTNTVVLDRTPAPSANGSAGTFYVGGALDLAGSLCDSFCEMLIGGNQVFIKAGTYALGSTVSVASTSSSSANGILLYGYSSVRGDLTRLADEAAKSSKPIIACAALAVTFGQYWKFQNVSFTSTAAAGVSFGAGSQTRFCHLLNTSTTANRVALTQAGADGIHIGTEATSQNGIGINITGNNTKIHGCYVHDSDTGIQYGTSRGSITFCVVKSCRTIAISLSSASSSALVLNNLVYGSQANIGTGILLSASAITCYIINNIVYGCVTGISQTTAANDSNILAYNVLYDNGTNYSNVVSCVCDTTNVDPAFTDAAELSGSTATISGNVVTQVGAFGSVTPGQDYFRSVSGTGATTGIYGITAATSDTVTLNNTIGTNATPDKVWVIPYKHNMLPTGAI